MKVKSLIALLLTLFIIGGSVYVAFNGIGKNHTGGVKDMELGLDLEGGVSITYKTEKENPTADEISDTIYKLQLRLDSYGYTEGEVYREGNDRINVDIPGATDANQVLEKIGQPGKLEFIDAQGNVVLSGADIKNAEYVYTPSDIQSPHNIRLELNQSGVQKFADATAPEHFGETIAIYYDGNMLMAPTVQSQILNGEASITRLSSEEQARNMASNIRSGALPINLIELRSNVVGAKLGKDAIDTSVKAGFIAFIILFAFMIVFYRLPGFLANIALTLYITLTLIIMSLCDIVLTLPGIAGLILSIGMALDANVIIFARIREELALEKTLKASIKAGYKKALSSILDGNITTFIVAVVLYFLGTGPIKGFAVTLGLGIIVSMFTAIFVTRLLLVCFMNLGLKNKKLYGLPRQFGTLKIIEKARIWIGISLLIIVIGVIKLPINKATYGTAFQQDIDFAGGTSTVVSLGVGNGYETFEELESAIRDLVVEATGDSNPQFQNVKNTGSFIIKTRDLNTQERMALEKALIEKYGIDSSSIETQSISATISNEMKRDAVIAVLIVVVCILIYVTFRFNDYRFGVGGIVALIHDVLIMVVVYAAFNFPINNSFIAAILTIIGYSINDTIVIFDRIRENQKHMKRGDYLGVVNTSVTQTLSRSLNTSITTFIAIFVLYIVGVESIKDFALPIMVGVIAGTYSSIFIASPVWYFLKMREEKRINKVESN